MTTIAYKNGVIAYDSYTTNSFMVVNHSAKKHIEIDGVHLFLAGSRCYFQNLINAYFGREYNTDQNDVRAIIIDKDGIFDCAIDQEPGSGGFWKSPIDIDQIYAIGSGEHFAITAMDLGKTAAEAVDAAAHRDLCTGGEICVFDVIGFFEENEIPIENIAY